MLLHHISLHLRVPINTQGPHLRDECEAPGAAQAAQERSIMVGVYGGGCQHVQENPHVLLDKLLVAL